ncbi:MAG: GTPase HflX [Bacillota bacterium]|nr:GTPase HflX [Bacillota bacterium]
MIYGNVEGIRNFTLNKLEKAYELFVDKDSLLSEELINLIAEITIEIGREVSIAVDRRGKVINAAIGDSSTVEIPIINIKEKRLSGVRIIHTHPNGSSRLSALDKNALIKLKLDCMAAIAVNTESKMIEDITLGFCNIENEELICDMMNPMDINTALRFNISDKIRHIENLIKNTQIIEDESERAIIVGVESEESLIELKELAKACEVKVVEEVLQKRNKIDTSFYIGRGKVEEICLLRQVCRANVIIFDDELSGSQVRNLENMIGVKVIDRTTLILEIFAKRAKTREAKIQVELAQLKYRLPRLMGLGTVLSRTGGGIGTKGPGEKKLEIDRRHIKEGIYALNDELLKVKKIRDVQREKRNNIPKVSLVGYTNAGKSTLRNTLCDIATPKDAALKEKIFEADMLFATLDTTTRAIMLPDNRLITVTDTVGFIRKLPHDLVESFKSTLEEAAFADLLLHVVDVSESDALLQIEAVNQVLSELKVTEKPIALVLNKIDKADENIVQEITNKYNNIQIIKISAKMKINLDLLLNEIAELLPIKQKKVNFLIPYSEQKAAAFLHRNSVIKEEEFREEGTFISAEVDEEVYGKCSKYII